MQFHQLYCFTKVAEKKSFSKAAEDIFLSQSTVSTHISNLEDYFNEQLFDRLGKQVVLSPFGEKLYYWAQELLKLKDTAIWDLKDWSGKIEGQIRIAASTVPAQYMVPLLISKFVVNYPQIRFVLNQLNSKDVAEAVVKGEAHLGLLGEKYQEEKLDYIPLNQEKLVLITPKHIQLEDPVSMRQLAEFPFIFRKLGSGTQSIVDKLFKKAGLDIHKQKILGYFDSVEAIKQGVRQGLGVSIISEIAASDYVDNKLINKYDLKEFTEKRSFYFAYNNQVTLSPLIAEFINFSICSFQNN